MSPLRARLRLATMADHSALEEALPLGKTLTLERYGLALQVLHSIRMAWEPMLDRLLPGTLRAGWPGRHREWLEADLGFLNVAPLAAAPAPVIGTAGEAVGLRYVLEGSALGGRVILGSLAGLGLTEQAGGRYFAGNGDDTGRIWQAFLVDLERAGHDLDTGEIIEGAKRGFAAIRAEAGAGRPQLVRPFRSLP